MTTASPTSTMPLPKSYTPAEAEPTVRAKWEQADAWHTTPDAPGRPYCILIPPPNVTAALHLGHAFNNTLQDILIRLHRMKGFNTLWMPGTDHAGIATQTVVEKRLLQEEGRKRTDYTREEFVAKVQAWKDEYEATITEQLKSMGCSCDFDRQRFTMDEMCAKAVREAFFRLFKDRLIYRGKRLVNWDPVTQTALADDEVEMKEVDGHFWYLKYPVVQRDEEDSAWRETGEHVTVATTRPETYLGDTAVAVNPKDPQRAKYIGRHVRLPLVGRIIPIVGDDYVVMPDPSSSDPKAQYASGFLKVTPAHDPNDWEIGQRHGLDVINVMAPDASISDRHGWEDVGDAHLFVGLSREDARKKVIAEFEARGLLEATRPYRHSVGHSYRSHVPIEPYLSDQWYVKVTDDRLVGEAQRALADEQYEGTKPQREAGTAQTGDGALRFFPARYAKTYQAWHDNLRDWCISRQLWWGHRIPVWHKRVTLSEDNFVEELMPWGWDDFASGSWRDEGIHVRIVRVADGSIVDPAEDPLDPVVPSTEGEYDIYICLLSDSEWERQFEEHGFRQDPDVLDTWFSSGLWPLSTMGWPTPEHYPDTPGLLDTFNPTSVLCTAREIITLWVSRMVMFNRYFTGDHRVPFRDVYIHAMIQDGHGQKMSKSLGNGVDPRDIIHGHGADAMRFTLAQMATPTQDVRLPVDIVCPHCSKTFHPKEFTNASGYTVAQPVQTCPKCNGTSVSGYGYASGEAKPTDAMPLARNTSSKFDLGRNFCNKLWNATRFALGNLDADKLSDAPANDVHHLADRWILTRLDRTLRTIDDAVASYQFNVYAEAMYDFIWRDFCDWYLESIKPTVRDDPAQQRVLLSVLNALLRMLHPICPFVTETLWPSVRDCGEAGIDGLTLPSNDLLARAPWPQADASLVDDDAAALFERVQNLVNAIRQVRSENQVPPKQRIELHATDNVRALIEASGEVVPALAGLSAVAPLADPGSRPSLAVPLPFEGEELLLSGLRDAVDLDAERQRLEKLVAEKEKAVRGFEGKLANPGYVNNAPAPVVEETRKRCEQAQADLAAARQALASLGA